MLMDLPEIPDPKNKRGSAVEHECFLWAVFHSTALPSWFASSMFAEDSQLTPSCVSRRGWKIGRLHALVQSLHLRLVDLEIACPFINQLASNIFLVKKAAPIVRHPQSILGLASNI